jgi:uncharacterized protein
VIAVDTGVFVALADRSDNWHENAQRVLGTVEEGWVTTWPVLTEACWLMRRRIGADAVFDLMHVVSEGGVEVWSPSPAQAASLPVLMRRYTKLPMDLADASLVLLAEHLGHGRILSTDMRNFDAYRWKNRKPFKNLLETPR